MESIWQDLRYTLRGLMKAPGFTVVAVLTLALGIGANTVIFTVVEAALLRGLPYRDSERVLHLFEGTLQTGARQFSYLDYTDVRDRNRTFEQVAAYGFWGATIESAEGTEGLGGGRVSANFFQTLGVEPVIGRTFAPEEDEVGRPRDVVMLTYATWQTRYGGDPGVIGRSIRLSGQPFTVIGVTPRNFHFAPLRDPDIFVTLSPDAQLAQRRMTHFMWTVARLRPGVSLEQANADLGTMAKLREIEDPRWHKDTGMSASPIRETIVGPVRPILLGLLAAVAAVLLIACANVANMLLARASGRNREVGIRIALGAGRGRLVAQFLTESLLLAMLGGAAGLLWAGWGLRTMIAAIPASQLARLPFLENMTLHPGILAFTFGICVLTGVLFGVGPALRATHSSVAERVKDGGRSSGRNRMRSLLVVAEVGMALVLVTAAGLLGRSLVNLMNTNPGFDTQNLLTARLDIPGTRYDTNAKSEAFFNQLKARLEGLPGVSGVAFVDRLPLLGSGNTGTPSVVGRPPAGTNAPDAQLRTITPDYFRVMGIPLLAGRAFDERDKPELPMVVMVNQAFAKQIFPGEEVVGQKVTFSFMQGTPALEIVGLTADENVTYLDQQARPVLYFPLSQDGGTSLSLLVRLKSDPRALAGALRGEIRALEPASMVQGVRTMQTIINASQPAFLRRYPLMMLGSFAFVALVLAAIGLYGVMSYAVSQRTNEIGIRMAIGAQPRDVLGLVLKEGMGMVLAGVALGIAGGLAITRVLSNLLFNTGATDPATFAGAALVLTTVALVACYIPAQRAARVDPLVALRHE